MAIGITIPQIEGQVKVTTISEFAVCDPNRFIQAVEASLAKFSDSPITEEIMSSPMTI